VKILSSLLVGAMLAVAVMDSAASVDDRRFERMSQSEYFLMIRDGHLAWNRGDGKGAERQLLRAACAGDKDSQFMLGTMYLNGEGVEADALRAYGWYAVAAEVGDARYAAARDTVGRLIPGDFRDAASDEAARMLAAYGLSPTGQTCLMESITGSKIRKRVCRPRLTGGIQVRQFLVHQCDDAEESRLAQIDGRG
jgi:TPR repeat protein